MTSRALARSALAAGLAVAALAGCGGGSNPIDNPPTVENPPVGGSSSKLSFAYFQKCVNPILLAQLQTNINGQVSVNSCASGGCHSSSTGTGGALRVDAAAQAVDLSNAANTPDVVRQTDMYKNFYSSQGVTLPGSPDQSRLLLKPLVQGVLHGGGLIFVDANDPNAKTFRYWINRPMPQGQDEFSTAANSMFTPPDPLTGTCNVE
ncbi:hypothetical protein [Caldimonas sp. KR1-144]|uniref:hypothetical protein n=1 Tax=Caldimonas sp. KR1-144 TaxID=3400911 RepID=UPI003BFB7B3A